MPSETRWYNILLAIQREARGIALIALIANAAILATILSLPAEHRIVGFIVFAVVLVGTLIGAVIVAVRSSSQDHNQPHLGEKVRLLKDKLFEDGFFPHLIIAIPRGGLAVAGILARQLGEERIVPVISLCRSGPRDFDSPLNHVAFTRRDFDANTADPLKILIVDDTCRSGGALANAKAYVKRSIDPGEFVIKTAAISFMASSRAIAPSFFVDRPKGSIRDSSGEVEPTIE